VENLGDMFYNGKPEARSAGFLGTAFVDAVETLEDAGLAFFGDADTRVLHDNGVRFHKNDDFPALFRITDGVIDQVENHFEEQFGISLDFGILVTV
jgi:hypothetical protein